MRRRRCGRSWRPWLPSQCGPRWISRCRSRWSARSSINYRPMPPRASLSAMVVDAESREVRAVVSGDGSRGRGGALDLTRAWRSPGSALKPLLYGLGVSGRADLAEHPGQRSAAPFRPLRAGGFRPQLRRRGDGGRGTATLTEPPGGLAARPDRTAPVPRLADGGWDRTALAAGRGGVAAAGVGGRRNPTARPGAALRRAGHGWAEPAVALGSRRWRCPDAAFVAAECGGDGGRRADPALPRRWPVRHRLEDGDELGRPGCLGRRIRSPQRGGRLGWAPGRDGHSRGYRGAHGAPGVAPGVRLAASGAPARLPVGAAYRGDDPDRYRSDDAAVSAAGRDAVCRTGRCRSG